MRSDSSSIEANEVSYNAALSALEPWAVQYGSDDLHPGEVVFGAQGKGVVRENIVNLVLETKWRGEGNGFKKNLVEFVKS